MTRRRSDEGVSSVVSAVLVFALFVTVATVYTVQTLPERIEAREAAHQQAATAQIAGLRTGLETLAARGDPGPVTAVVDLGPSPVGVLQRTPAASTLGFGGAFSVEVSSTAAIVLASGSASGGASVVGGSAATPIAGDVIENVQLLEALVIGMGDSFISGASDYTFARIDATDAQGTVVRVELQHTADAFTPEVGCMGRDIRLKVQTTETTHHLVQCGVDQRLVNYAMDVLDPSYPVRSAFMSLTAPVTLTLTDGGSGGPVEATYRILYRDPSGLIQGSTTGTPRPYTTAVQGTSLVMDPSYQAYVDESVVWEGGAILRVQGEQAAVAVDPGFRMTVKNGVGHLQWTLTQVDGQGAVSGTGFATVHVTHKDSRRTVLQATDATITLQSAYADAWRQYFQDHAFASGASSAVLIGGSGDTVTMTLGTGPVSAWRLDLLVVQAQAAVR